MSQVFLLKLQTIYAAAGEARSCITLYVGRATEPKECHGQHLSKSLVDMISSGLSLSLSLFLCLSVCRAVELSSCRAVGFGAKASTSAAAMTASRCEAPPPPRHRTCLPVYLSCPVLSCSVLSCPVLSYLSCLVLSCPGPGPVLSV